jgi:hypothetical protein
MNSLSMGVHPRFVEGDLHTHNIQSSEAMLSSNSSSKRTSMSPTFVKTKEELGEKGNDVKLSIQSKKRKMSSSSSSVSSSVTSSTAAVSPVQAKAQSRMTPTPEEASTTNNPQIARRVSKRLKTNKEAEALANKEIPSTATPAKHHVLCVDCDKKFRLPLGFSIDNFPSTWHCSDASWNPKFSQSCLKYQKKKKRQGEKDVKQKRPLSQKSKRSNKRSQSRQLEDTKVENVVEDLCSTHMSERQQLKVLNTIAALLEKEKEMDYRQSFLVPRAILNYEAALQDEYEISHCFYCNGKCSHSKLSLPLNLKNLGVSGTKTTKNVSSSSKSKKKETTSRSSTTSKSYTTATTDTNQQSTSTNGIHINQYVDRKYPSEPDPNCTTVLGHLVHKNCLLILQKKGLLSPIASKKSNESNTHINSDEFKSDALNEDLVLLKGLLFHPSIQMNNTLFSSKELQNASKRSRILVLEQDPDAIGMNLEKCSKKQESYMSSYTNYQTNFCDRFAARRSAHRHHIFGTNKNNSMKRSFSPMTETSSKIQRNATTATPPTTNKAVSVATHTPGLSSHRYRLQPLNMRDASIRSNSFFERTRKFCSHLDLLTKSNNDWSKQLNELSKLPSWLYCQTKDDVLHLLRKQIPGMTTPQMFIKVPGVWTAAHEENNQFRSINVNHGPGPCEWAGVAARHVPRLRQLILSSHNIDIYKEEGRWMPPLDYMIQHKIPVITGIQEEGDCIMVGIGCVHWVYSRGRTCCSAWNIGDLSFDMFEAAFRRSDDNLEIGR